ncbi:DUF2239 family protein [Deinococcus psychrotolerans]|uniref:DUF2239 family protein n=1 Tax=Deinococcus psychrotolerans TaxID=2489213 RepID=A0A3G8YCL4_9DEIO|nr:DUF2239 family protein [Deinococcus psychrotolerans]AZI43132.1 DUF2239 family protein [Deinococcus psychrotolerans]
MTDNTASEQTYTAFLGHQRLITAPLVDVLEQVKRHLDASEQALPILIFDDQTGAQVDFNFQGSASQMLAAAARPAPQPQAAVQEVKLLPRHWEWLQVQPSGKSATLRRLVDAARKAEAGAARARASRDAASHFLTVMAGDQAGLEDVQRALYAADRERFETLIFAADWPEGISAHALYLAGAAFGEETP